MNDRPDGARADEILRGVLRALGDEVRREFEGDARQHGPYRALRLIGSGATSEVFAASRDGGSDDRILYALKVVRPGADVREVLARFERERAIILRIAHAAFVPVLDAGMTMDGRPWFAMPYVDGGPITLESAQRGLPLARRMELALRAVEAIGAAHAAGVIHRDLKPGNILLEERAGALHPRIIDFGIARALAGDQARLTPNDHAHRLGTPSYMPPEQWRDGIAACDARSDVFALGIVLGELAAGRLPRDPLADRRGARSRPGPAIPPSSVAERASDRDRAWIARWIDPIFARATAEDPAGRHADAAEFGRALADALAAGQAPASSG